MIVPMQKVTMLGRAAWQDKLLESIRNLGIVHIMPLPPDNITMNKDDLGEVKDNINLLEEAISLLPDSSQAVLCPGTGDTLTCARQLLDITARQKNISNEIKDLEGEYKGLAVWGKSSPERLKILKTKGVTLRFFLVAHQDLDKIPAGSCVQQIGLQGKHRLLAIIGPDKTISGLSEIDPPARGIAAIEILLTEKKKELAANELQIKTLMRHRPSISKCLHEQKERLSFLEAKLAITTRHEISYLSGFCPVSKLPVLRAAAKRQKWGLLEETPEETDPVPTQMQYTTWSRIFKPLMDFIGVIPGYKEFDCNGPSLFFFIIFFAMLIGDAGYGLLFFLTGIFFLHQNRRPREASILLIILAAATMLWGGVTGTWFGIEGLEHAPLLGLMIVPRLAASAPENAASVMQICFLIGAVQLILAHLWLTVRKLPRLVALADIGWAMIVGAIYFISLFLVLNKPMPPLTFLLLAGGALMIMLFAEQSDTFSIRAIGKALAHSPLTLLSGINSLSDLISYIRLFAVGLATREVALAVNHMAINVGFETILSTMAAVAILLAGHGMNIILGAMAILVHGVRLNLLEFSRHLEINWSGIPYNPFKGNLSATTTIVHEGGNDGIY